MSLEDKYTAQEVADLLDVTVQRVCRYALTRKYKQWGGRYIFSKSDVKKMRNHFEIIDKLGIGTRKT